MVCEGSLFEELWGDGFGELYPAVYVDRPATVFKEIECSRDLLSGFITGDFYGDCVFKQGYYSSYERWHLARKLACTTYDCMNTG